MSFLNFTIEDTSPMVFYSLDWRAGRSIDDPLADQYSQGSFTLTNSSGALVSFTFNGTGVEIFGATRPNHGMYQVRLDGELQSPIDNGSTTKEIFQVSLYSVGGLTQGLHTVSLINLEEKFLDIDFITWETTISNNPDEKLYVDTFQDTSSSFTYLPTEADWAVQPKNLGSFLGGSGRATTTLGAFLEYIFEGDAVSFYGPVSPDGASYAVLVDGGPARSFSAQKEFYTPQSLLYHASSLGPGKHNLTLTYLQNPVQHTFAIDFAVVYATATNTTTTTSSFPTETDLSRKSASQPSQPIGLIVGLSVAMTILLIISCITTTLFWRHRRGQRKQRLPRFDAEPFLGVPTAPITHPPPTAGSPLPSNRYAFRFGKSSVPERNIQRLI
ncbi:hypothetical protein BDZ94DRAFT_1261530 [Collybia nuda]|uniref:Transmembrane protein n=1 Tax=Collybia nuda TaxID=64659 RepID=A0A9P5Y6Y6_9AGAR|nr:hypothetical protein BDZ94DRAFT_1261530 [Collybia nuda]